MIAGPRKKRLEQGQALFPHHLGNNRNLSAAVKRREAREVATRSPAHHVFISIDNPMDSADQNRAKAHQTGFHRTINGQWTGRFITGGVNQPPQRHYLGMIRFVRLAAGGALAEANSQNILLIGDHAAHRKLTG